MREAIRDFVRDTLDLETQDVEDTALVVSDLHDHLDSSMPGCDVSECNRLAWAFFDWCRK